MFTAQKAQEIVLALIKVAVYIRRPELRQRLEKLAFNLLETATGKEFESALKISGVLEGFILLGQSIYEIEPINARILVQELANLNAVMRQFAELDVKEGGIKLDISEIFSKVPAVQQREDINPAMNAAVDSAMNTASPLSIRQSYAEAGNLEENNGNYILGVALRQSAIIEKIRQSGKVALKDLLAAFPDVSERTLRYDLQKLCGQAVLERIGSSGPATYYVLCNKTINPSL